MENNDQITSLVSKPSVLNNALKYGFYTSAAYVVVSLMLYILDLTAVTWLNYVIYLIMIIGMVLAMLNYRNKLNGGYIQFGDAFLTGLYVSIITALVMTLYGWIYMTYINPDAAEQALRLAEERLLQKGFPDEVIEKQMSIARKMMNTPLAYIISIIWSIVIGAIVSLIAAAIVKKNDDSFNATFKE